MDRLVILIFLLLPLSIAGCAVENLSFQDLTNEHQSLERVITSGKVTGESATVWSFALPQELNDGLIKQARLDAEDKILNDHFILKPIINVQTVSIPMGITTLYKSKVVMRANIGEKSDPGESQETAEQNSRMTPGRIVGFTETNSKAQREKSSVQNAASEAQADKDSITKVLSFSDKKQVGVSHPIMEPLSILSNNPEPFDKAQTDLSTTTHFNNSTTLEQKNETKREYEKKVTYSDTYSDKSVMHPAQELSDPSTTRLETDFATPKYAQSCGVTVDIPESYNTVYVRPSKTEPIQIMTLAAYQELLKTRCPAPTGEGS